MYGVYGRGCPKGLGRAPLVLAGYLGYESGGRGEEHVCVCVWGGGSGLALQMCTAWSLSSLGLSPGEFPPQKLFEEAKELREKSSAQDSRQTWKHLRELVQIRHIVQSASKW